MEEQTKEQQGWRREGKVEKVREGEETTGTREKLDWTCVIQARSQFFAILTPWGATSSCGLYFLNILQGATNLHGGHNILFSQTDSRGATSSHGGHMKSYNYEKHSHMPRLKFMRSQNV